MRTTTLALLSGAAMSISAASIYNVTPAGGFRDSGAYASLEPLAPLAPQSWPQLAPEAQASANGFASLAREAVPNVTAVPTAGAFVDEPVAVPQPRPESTTQFAAAKPPKAKSASGWRAQRNPKPAFEPSFLPQQQQRVVVKRQEPQPPPQMVTSQSFQSAPASSVAAPASTSSARAMSTSR